MYTRTFISISKYNTLTFCILNSRRIPFSVPTYDLPPNTQEKNSNCLVDRQMLENGLLF